MVRPTFAWLAAALLCVRAAGAEFTIDKSGNLSIRSGTAVLLDNETLEVVNAGGTRVADLLANHLAELREADAVRSLWAADIGAVSRTVRRKPDGTVGVEWHVRLLNGIVEGRNLALAFDRPDGKAGIEITAEPPAIRKTGKPPAPGRRRVILLLPYFPARVNDYSITLAVSGN